jgi:hypothetical protein
MTLHVFNPEHDMALAANLSNFTSPRAGRLLRSDLGFLPALWAEEGDAVWVDDVAAAGKQWPGNYVSSLAEVNVTAVAPWGWDRALCAQLRRQGVPADVLPTDEQLERYRQLSHRRTAALLLPQLRVEGTVGEAIACSTLDEIAAFQSCHGNIVLKAPWSSSGRGVRFLSNPISPISPIGPIGPMSPMSPINSWITRTIQTQGCIMAEPKYEKVMDFGMEFEVDEMGQIRYCGLSLFHTVGSAYVGNLLVTERRKQEVISRYIPASLLEDIKERIRRCLSLSDYRGCFGVDMMICASPHGQGETDAAVPYLLHPCVEINLRRTMGHVALALHRRLNPTDDDAFEAVMQVKYDGAHYHLSYQ